MKRLNRTSSSIRVDRNLLLWVLASCVVFSGCGSAKRKVGDLPVYSVRGSVTFNGEPLEAAIVTLRPIDENKKQPASQGVTDELGEFVLSTYNVGDGAPDGKYTVTISCEDRNGKKVGGEFPERLPVRYQSPATSGLKATVEEGDNELETFQLVK